MGIHGLANVYHSGRAALTLLKVASGWGRAPLFASWNVTFSCNLRCAYCGASDAPRRECDTKQVMQGVEHLYRLGARWITFGGGEPLLRPDMGELIAHAKSVGFQVFLSTNGWFVPERMEELRQVDNITLSLDGPESVHDAVRGRHAFQHTIQAARAASEAGVPFSFQCVLARHNLTCIEETLAIAREHHALIMFQPATQWLDSSTAPNPLAPPAGEYRAAMKQLLALKQHGAPIANSRGGLEHLARYPDPSPIRCLAGRLMVIVEPDGHLLSCHQCEVNQFLAAEDTRQDNIITQFQQTTPPQGCDQCWCAPVVELALICSFKPEPIWNTLRRFF